MEMQNLYAMISTQGARVYELQPKMNMAGSRYRVTAEALPETKDEWKRLLRSMFRRLAIGEEAQRDLRRRYHLDHCWLVHAYFEAMIPHWRGKMGMSKRQIYAAGVRAVDMSWTIPVQRKPPAQGLEPPGYVSTRALAFDRCMLARLRMTLWPRRYVVVYDHHREEVLDMILDEGAMTPAGMDEIEASSDISDI